MGLDSLTQQNLQGAGLTGIDRLARNSMFPQSQMDKTQYAVSSQLPTSAATIQSDYDTKTDAYTGLPAQAFRRGGIARFFEGGGPPAGKVWSETQGDWVDPGPNSGAMPGSMPIDSNLMPVVEMPTRGLPPIDYSDPSNKQAVIADLYKKLLGRDPNQGEDIMQWQDYLGEGNPSDILSLADRLAQTEEGTAYGKSEGNKVFSNMVALTQPNSPFAGTENPYSNMKFLGGEKDAEGNPLYRFQDQNSGLMTVDANGQPIKYEPGAGWYDEQLRNRQDALRGYNYRNQSYLSSGPLDQTYKFNGIDVPISANEYQVDPKTGQFVKGKTGENVPLQLKDKEYNMWDDWAAPLAVVGIPLAMSYAAPYLAGEAALAASTAGATEAGGAAAAGGGAAGGGGAAAGAGGAAAGTAGAGTAMNVLRGAMLANSLVNQLGGGSRQGYSGQGLNPNAGNTGFNPNTAYRGGLPINSGYEKTPWANLMPQISLSKLSEFAPREMSGGGQAEAETEEQILKRIRHNIKGSSESNIPRMVDNLLESQRRAELLDKINARFDVPSSQYVEGLGLMTPPPSVNGRLGVNSEAFGGNVRAGLSGNAMMTPDKKILANPGMMDIGYRSSKESEYDPTFDISLQRAIKSMPGRSKDYAVAANYTMPFAQGGIADIGHLGGYSDGGRLLKGPGDGMSDNIPATISNKQPARLADGEFVIPADVVSHLGNGSTDAGAKQLYAMMDKIRKARTGTKKQGKQIKPSKFLPKG